MRRRSIARWASPSFGNTELRCPAAAPPARSGPADGRHGDGACRRGGDRERRTVDGGTLRTPVPGGFGARNGALRRNVLGRRPRRCHDASARPFAFGCRARDVRRCCDGGNGAAMRAHPVGFLADRNDVLRVAAIQARVTHGHHAAVAAAQAVALLVHDALAGRPPSVDPPAGIGDTTFVTTWRGLHAGIAAGRPLPPHLQNVAMLGNRRRSARDHLRVRERSGARDRRRRRFGWLHRYDRLDRRCDRRRTLWARAAFGALDRPFTRTRAGRCGNRCLYGCTPLTIAAGRSSARIAAVARGCAAKRTHGIQ